jgi:hypothetical protein
MRNKQGRHYHIQGGYQELWGQTGLEVLGDIEKLDLQVSLRR